MLKAVVNSQVNYFLKDSALKSNEEIKVKHRLNGLHTTYNILITFLSLRGMISIIF